MSGTRFYIIFFMLLIPGYLFARGDNSSYSFRHYDTEQGLSNNWVFSFPEDDLGFIWIGTRDGLNRFDGYDFKVYDETNSRLASIIEISAIQLMNIP